MISGVTLKNFRSYSESSFELEKGVNIIVGPNASGKTNLLESILVLASGSSYRAKDQDLIKNNFEWARLDCSLLSGDSRTVKFQRDNDKLIKTFEINEKPFTRLTLANKLPIVLFEPDHLRLLTGSPDNRRLYLDDLIDNTSQSYGTIRRHYRRVLAQRNSLLKRNPTNLKQQLFVWNLRLSELGVQIASHRQVMIDKFNENINELYNSIAGKDNNLNISYLSKFSLDNYASQLLKKLESSIDIETQRGFTLYGPHREDFSITLNSAPASVSASRGEVRTLLLSLKLLELQIIESARGNRPLLLLDDVFSELDDRRRRSLTQYVQGYQTFITTTDADVVIEYFTKTANIIPISTQE